MQLHACLLLFIFTTVQENESTPSDWESTTHPGRDLLRSSQTGTSFSRTASIGQDVVRRTKSGSRGPEEWTSGTRFMSSPSSQDQGLLHPTSPRQGLSTAGNADRETISFPEEGPNNQTETSGAAHLADGPVSARERTHPYFQLTSTAHTQFDTSHSANTETNTHTEIPQTQMGSKHTTASGTEMHEYTNAQTPEISATTRAYPTVSRSSVPNFTPSKPELPPWTTLESLTMASPPVGAVSGSPGDTLPHSWRNQRGTDQLDANTTSAVTSDLLKSPTEPQQSDLSTPRTDTEPTPSSLSQEPNEIHPSSTYITASDADTATPNIHQTDSRTSAASDGIGHTFAMVSDDEPLNTERLQSLSSSPITQTKFPQSAVPSPLTSTSDETTTNAIPSLPGSQGVSDRTVTGSSTPTSRMLGDMVQNSASPTGLTADTEPHTRHPTLTLLYDHSHSNPLTPTPHLSSSTSVNVSTSSHTLQTHMGTTHRTRSSSPSPPVTSEPAIHAPLIDHTTTLTPTQTPTIKSTTSHTTLATLDHPDTQRDTGLEGVEKDQEILNHSNPTTSTPTAGPTSRTRPHPVQENPTAVTPPAPAWSATATPMPPKVYVVPDEPAAIRVESIDLLLQIVVEDSTSASASGLEEDAAAWLEPNLQRAPGFDRLLGVWSSGHAVQTLVRFQTSGALRWIGSSGPASLLERTGLAQALREGRSLKSSVITNITLGGLQGEVCDWLLQCQPGYRCVSRPGASNYSCSSICHFDHCHHHGICTHHPGQFPVCRCLVGQDFWFMGQRCDTRMTHARLVGSCLAILLIMVTLIGVLAFVAVRRYRAVLIQAKVDQTRSSYRRFNHFDELSGRFWLRSWAGSADSLDNPAFTRSDELLHLRTLDRPCCYHDDTLSLPSTCPSHGARINTIYLHRPTFA
ncbi:mucin-2 isoform X2 [Antennarius striatus]|uniref:mucin-2 isoform X2 n=1 Tax=Antennarius striatus TaxID=241820 RepID=UPI0035B22B1C